MGYKLFKKNNFWIGLNSITYLKLRQSVHFPESYDLEGLSPQIPKNLGKVTPPCATFFPRTLARLPHLLHEEEGDAGDAEDGA